MAAADSLIARMRKAREIDQDALGHRFTLRIPNAGEMEDWTGTLGGRAPTFRRLVLAFTVGWDLREIDLIPGGGPEPVAFAPELFEAWLNDHPDAVTPLFDAMTQGMERRLGEREDAVKN